MVIRTERKDGWKRDRVYLKNESLCRKLSKCKKEMIGVNQK